MRPEDTIRVGRIVRVLHEFVRPRRRGPSLPLEVSAYHVHGEPIPAEQAFAAEYQPFPVGGAWGPPWDTTWFRLAGTIPLEWAGRQVALGFVIGNAGSTGFGAEALVWRQGRPVQGLSPNHREYLLTGEAGGGEPVSLYVEAAANPPSPFGANPWPLLMPDPEGAPQFTLQLADLHVRDPRFEEFWHDFRVLAELMGELPDDGPLFARLCQGLDQACNLLDLPDIGDSWQRAHPVLKELLGARSGAGDPSLQHGRPRSSGHRLALAPSRDGPQVRADLLHGGRAHGPVPRVPVRRLTGATPGMDAGRLPRSVGAG